MSGIKRKIEDGDPDYEDIALVQNSKRNKAAELSARDATVQKIEAIITEQFSLEMKNKEHEIDIISQRLNEARRMMDKLRACIVANFYANAGMTKLQESSKSDPAVLNHPAIRRFLESPSRSSSPLNQGSETPSLAQSESESLSQHGDATDKDAEGVWREDSGRSERRPGRNTGKDTFGVPTLLGNEQKLTYNTTGDEASRLYAKKTIVVGNVSKYIPPDKREENDQSTHKWMVYVRGSRKEPSIDHFVKKVWFFLHPSYKPNDLVEVSEPPFHLTRRGWGEFPVRIQIHFKDPRNKRIDIIHQLKLDRTYTGLQTLGAETVVDVELQRNSLGEEYILQSSSSKVTHRANSPMTATSTSQPCGHSSLPISYDFTFDKALIKADTGRSAGGHGSGLTAGERTPTRPKASDRITLGSHGNSAFQPITASCKIVPQGQPPSPAESPGKSFQPITMSCKIVSGSPISTPSHSPLPRTPTSTTPVHSKHSSSSVLNNPYVIVDKPGQVTGVATSSAASAGSPSAKQSTAQGTRSPAPKVHTGTFLSSGMKVIIKQEPGEVSTQQQQQMSSTVTTQQQSAGTASHQFVSVKGGHMISMSAQKQGGGGSGTTTNKMLGIPVSSTLQSAVKQVAISSGQILVAKGNASVSKVVGGKQVLAQGVAKAIVSGASGISGQQATAKAGGGSSGKTGVMATLQLPANNLANLANLPPGTKLYLTTNSKNPSGKGKLLLIPQGAILRASGAGQQSQSSSSAGAGGTQTSSSSSSSSSLPSNLSYTSYILKQTPQGTFLVGQPSQGSGKQGHSGVAAHAHTSSPATAPQQGIRVTAGQKAAILAQMVGGSHGAQVKLSDGYVKTVTAAGHVSKPGMTTLRMTGGVITAASSTPSSVSALAAANQQQASDGGKSASQHHSLLMAANQAAVISAAKSASAAGGGGLSKTAVATLVKGAANSAAMTKSAAGSAGAPVTVAKGIASMPVVSMAKGAGAMVSKNASTSLVTAASLVSGMAAGGGKTASTLSGMLKIHSGGANSQQTVLTIPANQLKQLGVTSGSAAMQTILMPVGKVKTEPCAGTAVTAGPSPPATAPVSTSVHIPSPNTTVKQEQGTDHSTHDLINTEHIETMMQLMTAVVKKFPLIVPDKSEDSHPFCASSTEQYYSWNIGKRRASELQRAVVVKRTIQNVLDHSPRLQALTPPKTREVVQWCRQRGYTPPDPEPLHKNDDESIEDILTQIDSEPECPTTLTSSDELVLRLEQMQDLLKTEPEEADDEIVDIITVMPPCQKLKVKEEEQEADTEPKFFLVPCMAAQFVSETAEQIGITFQPAEVEKNLFAPVIEDMILKATEQLASDILREALAAAFAKSPQNRFENSRRNTSPLMDTVVVVFFSSPTHRAPREITPMNVHQAICSIPTCDFLTNSHMGYLIKDN
ncbi:YEATS domain-containing protein 2 isoform X2 [Phyllopteryx taeniolatus]|uniref:YEATS domain-containing protein 2 isoform X2 n=1 Tax=Phyllopteryx taeniolatus TaxID=161469 RepID=UPI002AD50BF7|nr:YEATS domain-containing protein 2 isoform X2 [Phyllopteryx taeniolatus]